MLPSRLFTFAHPSPSAPRLVLEWSRFDKLTRLRCPLPTQQKQCARPVWALLCYNSVKSDVCVDLKNISVHRKSIWTQGKLLKRLVTVILLCVTVTPVKNIVTLVDTRFIWLRFPWHAVGRENIAPTLPSVSWIVHVYFVGRPADCHACLWGFNTRTKTSLAARTKRMGVIH